mmetsp:Transcript_11321/g.45993  ORF Transcript_11321/g.45993 Transcript_11321/m.45993 type:complete len:314 (-) Transcript_11321:4-945(-)
MRSVSVRVRYRAASPASVYVCMSMRGRAVDCGNAAAVPVNVSRSTACNGPKRRPPLLWPTSVGAIAAGRRAPALGMPSAHCCSVRRAMGCSTADAAACHDAVDPLLVAVKADEENAAEVLLRHSLCVVLAYVGGLEAVRSAPGHHPGNLLLVTVEPDQQDLLELLHVRQRGLVTCSCWVCRLRSGSLLASLLPGGWCSKGSLPPGDDLLHLSSVAIKPCSQDGTQLLLVECVRRSGHLGGHAGGLGGLPGLLTDCSVGLAQGMRGGVGILPCLAVASSVGSSETLADVYCAGGLGRVHVVCRLCVLHSSVHGR